LILTDTGPIVALVDSADPSHASCVAIVKGLPAEPLLTTWPCFTEAMYLLGSVGGYKYQAELWRLWSAGRLALHDLTSSEMERMAAVMEKYRDTPMDLADASLVAAAESLSMRRVLSLDRDFFIYRLADGTALEVIQ
jgi:predicted nucleic acid-binding protein